MEMFPLVCHPDTPAGAVESITVHTERTGQRLWLRYHVECELNALVLPGPAAPARCEGLWQSTCFEAFLRDERYATSLALLERDAFAVNRLGIPKAVEF